MSEHERTHVVSVDPACASVVAALEHDPFYRAICAGSVRDVARRRAVLTRYLDLYNQERPHQALNYRKPGEVYQLSED